VEERYADAVDGPGAVAGGGGDWKEAENSGNDGKLKRGRSPEDEGDSTRLVNSRFFLFNSIITDARNRVNEVGSTKTATRSGCKTF
jgi:nuclear cap-binding protein subunit 2